jgi:hypothetical protein
MASGRVLATARPDAIAFTDEDLNKAHKGKNIHAD